MKNLFSSPSFIISGLFLFCLFLFLYSFTQIDLSLTFSQASLWQTIQKSFQYIGYFNRPVSVQLFFLIVIGLFTFYILLLRNIQIKTIEKRSLWILIGAVTVLLTITYNAFSYDLFNYIFDAKIITAYQENPYVKKALDFPQDPMLSFMRWTHRVYPYGPVWLGLTVPLSFLGFQKFVITFFLFKALMTAAFLGTVYYLYQILKKLSPTHALYGTAFFALNPLVLIESVVSAHNDIVMLFFVIAGVYYLTQKKHGIAVILLLLSIGIKFVTVFLLPIFLFVMYKHWRKEDIPWEKVLLVTILSMIAAVIAASVRTNFQPWYLLYMLPFAALLSYKKSIILPAIVLSLTALLNYVPFLLTGNWDPPIPTILMYLNIISGILALILFFLFRRDNTVKI